MTAEVGWNAAQRARLRVDVVDRRPEDVSEAQAEEWLADAIEAGPWGYAGDDTEALIALADDPAAMRTALGADGDV